MNDLTIVIVAYNARAYLERCLRALHAPPPRCSHAVVVVDNGSQDGGVDRVRRNWPSVRIIESGGNVGYAKANNAAIRATESDLILLLNSDAEVRPGAVDRLVDRLRAHPGAAAAGPRLTDAGGAVEISFGPMLNPWNEARRKLRDALLAHGAPVLSTWVARAASRPRLVDWVSGACLLVRRVDAEAAGLLDERFFLYFEDVDFCASLRRLGRKVLFTPEAEAVHHGGRSGVRASPFARAAYRRSQLAFYEKHHPAWVPTLRLYLRARRALPPATPLLYSPW